MVRCAVFDEGTLVSSSEAIKATYDGGMSAQRFVFVPPDGKQARPFQPAVTSAQDEDEVASGMEGPPANGDMSPNRPASPAQAGHAAAPRGPEAS